MIEGSESTIHIVVDVDSSVGSGRALVSIGWCQKRPMTSDAADEILAQVLRERRVIVDRETPHPILLACPAKGCGERHVDEGEWATRPHHTHACQACGHVWRPAVFRTVGVRFLPGFGPSWCPDKDPLCPTGECRGKCNPEAHGL